MTKITGAKNGNVIEAKFNTRTTGLIAKDSSVLITISINNEYFCDQWLRAILKAAKEKFSKITILIVDAPNAYNLEGDKEYSKKTHEDRVKQALFLGDEWWKKGKNIFIEVFGSKDNETLVGNTVDEQIASFNLKQKTKGPQIVEVIRWNDWVKGEILNLEGKQNEFKGNNKLQSSVENSAKSYVDRQGVDANDYKDGFKKYLFAEGFGMFVLMEKRKFDYMAYPSTMLEALKTIYNLVVSPSSGKTADKIWLEIEFKRSLAENQKEKLSKLTNNHQEIAQPSPATAQNSNTNSGNNNESNNNSDLTSIIKQLVAQEMSEITKENEQVRKKLADVEEQLRVQKEKLQKLEERERAYSDSEVEKYSKSSSSPPKEHYFPRGIVKKEFLKVLEERNPALALKHSTLFKTKDEVKKEQRNTFPLPHTASGDLLKNSKSEKKQDSNIFSQSPT